MTDINPEEDELVTRWIEEIFGIFETAYVKKGSSMDKIQDLGKSKMELRLMFDEILQIDSAARTRVGIESIVSKFVERSTVLKEDSIPDLIEGICDMLHIQK